MAFKPCTTQSTCLWTALSSQFLWSCSNNWVTATIQLNKLTVWSEKFFKCHWLKSNRDLKLCTTTSITWLTSTMGSKCKLTVFRVSTLSKFNDTFRRRKTRIQSGLSRASKGHNISFKTKQLVIARNSLRGWSRSNKKPRLKWDFYLSFSQLSCKWCCRR